jgi:DNA repair protein RecO (recombination protein O)
MSVYNNRVTLQPGYVLHHWPYRDTSLLVEILTRDHGRIGLVARGAKRSKSRLYGLLQPFIPLIISWTGKGDLGTLGAVEAQDWTMQLGGRAMMNGFYVNELLLRLLHRHDPHPHLYDEYIMVLQRLSDTTGDTAFMSSSDVQDVSGFREQRALRIFEKNLLRELGYGLVLDHDVVTGHSIREDGRYEYYLDRGPVLRTDPGTRFEDERQNGSNAGSDNQDGNDYITLSGRSLVSLARNRLEDDLSLQESKKLMRVALKRHLGDKPLGSRQLFRNFVHARTTQSPDTANT